jgi:hypothetical protein
MAFFTKTTMEKPANKATMATLHKRFAHANIEAIQHLPTARVGIEIIDPKIESLDDEICRQAKATERSSGNRAFQEALRRIPSFFSV